MLYSLKPKKFINKNVDKVKVIYNTQFTEIITCNILKPAKSKTKLHNMTVSSGQIHKGHAPYCKTCGVTTVKTGI